MTVPLVAAGCKGVGGLGTLPKAGPDVAVLHGAIGTEQALIARYRSAMAGSPGLAGTLGPLLAQHREHLARLTSMLIEPPAAARPARPRRRPPARRARDPPRRPRSPPSRRPRPPRPAPWPARLALAPPALAQLLASIAASEASHALLLRTVDERGRMTAPRGPQRHG